MSWEYIPSQFRELPVVDISPLEGKQNEKQLLGGEWGSESKLHHSCDYKQPGPDTAGVKHSGERGGWVPVITFTIKDFFCNSSGQEIKLRELREITCYENP